MKESIRVLQMFCQRRHLVSACSYDSAVTARTDAIRAMRARNMALIREGKAKPWCRFCGGIEWMYEVAPQQFASFDEAQIFLAALEMNAAAFGQASGQRAVN